MKRFFPILAVLSSLLYPINTIAGEPEQRNGVATDPQTVEVYPITSGKLAVTPEWVYPFPGLTTFKTPCIEPPRSPPYSPTKQRSKSASVSSGKKGPTSGDGGASIVVYGSDGTQRIVQPSQTKKTFEDGTVVYGLDKQ